MKFNFLQFARKSKHNKLLYIGFSVLIFAVLFKAILDYYNLLEGSSKYEDTFGNLEISMLFLEVFWHQ